MVNIKDFIKQNKIFYNNKLLNVIYKKSIDSTNSFADELSKKDDKEYLIIADTQTSGRGQKNNIWFSPSKLGLYFSIILKREIPTRDILNEPVFWGKKVKKTIEELTNINCLIKHPNDVLVNNKKVAGVLLESKIFADICKTLIVGIGVNINNSKDDFSKELLDIATSLYIETGRKINRIEFLKKFFTVKTKFR